VVLVVIELGGRGSEGCGRDVIICLIWICEAFWSLLRVSNTISCELWYLDTIRVRIRGPVIS
jgi:hypothetical protein